MLNPPAPPASSRGPSPASARSSSLTRQAPASAPSVTITATASTDVPAGTLRLRGAPEENRPKVRWDAGVVDNEGMGKKKSKICCIYHPPREFGESSDESSSSSDSDSDSDSEPDYDPRRRLRRNFAHESDHDHDGCEHGSGSSGRKKPHRGRKRKNAYEIQPEVRKNKSG